MSTSIPRTVPPTKAVLLIGGIGRMESLYRACVESMGYQLIYREQRLTGNTPPGNLAVIIVITTAVSHPLRERAARIASACQVPIVYLRQPSLSALRKALEVYRADS